MATSTSTKVALGCLVVGGLGVIATCGGLLATLMVAPSVAASWFVSDEPLPIAVVPPDPAAAAAVVNRICPDLVAGNEIVVSGPEAMQLWYVLVPPQGGEPPPAALNTDPSGAALFDLSAPLDDPHQYLNIHVKTAFDLQHGWFTNARIDEFTVGSFDLTRWLAGQDATAQFNQQLAQQRGEDPSLAATLDRIATLRTTPEGFALSLQPGEPPELCQSL